MAPSKSAPRTPGVLIRVLDGVVFYAVLCLTGLISWIAFRWANRLTIIGQPYTGPEPGTAYAINHLSMVDSFIANPPLFYPWILRHPDLAPYHLADEKNFMTRTVLRHFFRILRVIPVKRDGNGERHDRSAFMRAISRLRYGHTLQVFIEGTRSATGELLEPKMQVGAIILLSGAAVRPVYHWGALEVQPYRRRPGDGPPTWLRRVFGAHVEWLLDIRGGHQLIVNIGPVITPAEIIRAAGEGDTHTRAMRVAELVMSHLRQLKAETEAYVQNEESNAA